MGSGGEGVGLLKLDELLCLHARYRAELVETSR